MAPDDVVADGDDHPQQRPQHRARPRPEDEYGDVLASLDEAGLPGACFPVPDGVAIRVPLDDAQVLHIAQVAGPLPDDRADLTGWGVSVIAREAGEEPRLVAWDGAARTDVPGLLALVSAVLLDTMRGPSNAA
ncbi:hypothetical protein [Quadrisphaera sp. INWT6]|uniref:hypothetical protein n=1 Tax=Quadrisphaera sp. INWT6 TaxID=2596917 RepID=UPI0018921743|nr:hypothetical protein [Quadrisphaera sp. INWT6]MBF5083040.1 hypothetical protein [Quadrisphaera sp. INWT6]